MPEEPLNRSERTRDEIITAAHQLFLERGYHGTSMRQIAHCAGVALGGIYNHFNSKEDIFLAVFLERHPFYDVVPAMNAAQGETVEEFVRDAARRMVASLGERYDFLNLMFIELVEFNAQHVPRLFEIIFPEVLQFAQRFLQDQKEIRPIPQPILMRAFIGLFLSYTITDLLMGQNFAPESQIKALDYFVDIFLFGILHPPEFTTPAP
jgi:AcrR family transcriptional regulator